MQRSYSTGESVVDQKPGFVSGITDGSDSGTETNLMSASAVCEVIE